MTGPGASSAQEASYDERVEAFGRSLNDATDRFFARLEEATVAPFRHVLESAVIRHDEALEQLQLESAASSETCDDTPPAGRAAASQDAPVADDATGSNGSPGSEGAPGSDAAAGSDTERGSDDVAGSGDVSRSSESCDWAAIDRYRGDVLENVLTPMVEAVAALDPVGSIAPEIARLWNEWLVEVDELEIDVRRPEAEDLYDPSEGDSLWLRGRKAGVRLARWVRRVKDPQQSVPLRALGDFHVRVRLAGRLFEVLGRLPGAFGSPVAQLERAFTTWTLAVMESEASAEGPLDAAPEDMRRFADESTEPEEPTNDSATDDGPKWEAAVSAGERLQAALGRALEETGLSAEQEAASQVGATAWQELEEDVRFSGSFMLPANRLDHGKRREEPAGQHMADSPWGPWHHQAVARLKMIRAVHTFREQLSELLATYHTSVWEAGVSDMIERSRAVSDQLRQHSEDLDRAYGDHDSSRIPEFREELARVAKAVQGTDERHRVAIGRLQVEERVAQAANQAPEQILNAIAELPERFEIHALPTEDDAPPDPTARARILPLREIARQSFDALRLERLRTAADPVTAAVAKARAGADSLRSVAEFNLDAAASEFETEEDRDPSEEMAGALTLAVDGLARGATVLDDAIQSLGPALLSFGTTARDQLNGPWIQMRDRALARGAVQEQLLDLRSRMLEATRDFLSDLEKQWTDGGQVLRRYWRLVRAKTSALIRLGQSAVGNSAISEREIEASLQSVADFEGMLDSLPLVYRKLFSFQPLDDTSFLVGREDDMGWIQSRLEGWRPDMGTPIIITAFPGAGLTSFIQCLETSVFGERDVTRIVVPERVSTETQMAEVLSEGLGIDVDPRIGLESLATVLKQDAETAPRVILLEKLEHLMLRVTGGSDLVERMISFMSQTSTHVFWVSTMVESAWQFIEKTEPRAARLGMRRSLRNLTREQVEQAILVRHGRSGLPLRFADPTDPNPLLKRRLRRANGAAEREAVLKADFLERLVKATDGNLMLSFFYWLESVEFSEGGGVSVRPLRPLSFAYLGNLDPQQTFTLQAFLQHTTLTLREHDRIFACSRHESSQVFQSLEHLLLVRRVPAENGGKAPPEEVRYRIRPLMVQPVMRQLRATNVLH